MFNNPLPNQVFTPRDHKVNDDMYVRRPSHEERLRDALKGNRHFALHGESGNGKTWLFKKVFRESKTDFRVIGLSLANKLGSIEAAIAQKLDISESGDYREIERKYEGDGAIRVGGTGVGAKKTSTFKKVQQSPFFRMLEELRGVPGSPSVLVFDNFEWITGNQNLIEEMANLLILLDDEDFARYHVRICIVGVPGALKDYFSKLNFSQTISSRLIELPEVERMTVEEATTVLRKGFSQLRLQFVGDDSMLDVIGRLIHVTDRTATELHEIGLEVSLKARRNEHVVERLVVDDAIANWMAERHSSDCGVVERAMSPADTKFGRRNQLLYCLGLIDTEEFNITDIMRLLRGNFNSHASWADGGLLDVFRVMTEGFTPLIRSGMQGNTFRFSRSTYRMVIRSLLVKDENEDVFKIGKKL